MGNNLVKVLPYRDEYLKLLGISGDGMHVHHINGDRGDNRLGNLVLIPADLHQKYHASLKKWLDVKDKIHDPTFLLYKNDIDYEFYNVTYYASEISNYISERNSQIAFRLSEIMKIIGNVQECNIFILYKIYKHINTTDV